MSRLCLRLTSSRLCKHNSETPHHEGLHTWSWRGRRVEECCSGRRRLLVTARARTAASCSNSRAWLLGRFQQGRDAVPESQERPDRGRLVLLSLRVPHRRTERGALGYLT